MKPNPDASPDFQALFEGAPNLYLVLTPDLKIAAVSDAYCRATMTTRDGILGLGIFDAFPDNPADTTATGAGNLRSSLDRVRQFRRPDAMAVQKYDIPRPASEGGGFEERYWSPLNTPVLDGHGEVAWIIHRVEDVTELVQLQAQGAASNKLHQEQLSAIAQLRDANRTLALRDEENAKLQQSLVARAAELRESEARLRGFLAASPDAMIIVDPTSRILLASHRVQAMFGYAPEELSGEPIGVLLPERYRDIHADHLRHYMKAPKGRNMGAGKDLHALRKDGSEFPVEISLNPDRSGETPVVIAAVRDITDRKAVEMQLRQAQKMEAIGNLTGGMAHDFNNLLSIIIGNLDLLRGQLSDGAVMAPDIGQFSGEALDAALRGADLTRRLLAFARRQPLQPLRIDVNDLVARMSNLVSRTLGGDIEIGLELGADVWPVIADPAQLEASLVNIFNNARDAMPKGGVLTVTTGNRNLDEDYAALHPGLASGHYTLIEVSDTGTGIPPELLSHIFEPFFTTKEQGPGTGLGLSMVFGFLKQSGGHINVYSEAGHGTTVRLYLPRATTAAGAAGTRATAAFERGGHETILAVEDNTELRRVVARQLIDLGYRLFEAEDGAAALKILESEPIDLLFTDIVMPGGMNGYDLARTAVSRWPAMKVLLTSGFPEAKLNGNGGPPVNMRLLTKPYRKDDLARALRDILDAN